MGKKKLECVQFGGGEGEGGGGSGELSFVAAVSALLLLLLGLHHKGGKNERPPPPPFVCFLRFERDGLPDPRVDMGGERSRPTHKMRVQGLSGSPFLPPFHDAKSSASDECRMNGTSFSIYKGVMLRNKKKMNRTMKTTGKARKKSNSGPKMGGKRFTPGGTRTPIPGSGDRCLLH